MWKVLLVLGLVAMARLSHSQAAGWAGMISARADSNDIRMAKLNDRLDDIADLIESLGEGDGVSTDDLGARVKKLTGNGCDDNFQCGGDAPQCVSTLAVCDGTSDCRNGADEENCKNPAYPGTAWSGTIQWDSCSASRETLVRIVVNSEDRPDYFRSRSWLEATVILEKGDGYETMTTTGFYNYGRRRLVFQPTSSLNVGIACDFDGIDWNRCVGEVLKPSLDKCADVILVRK